MERNDFRIRDGDLVKYLGDGGEVVIPEGVTKICREAFFMSNVTRVVVPEGVKSLGSRAFSYCRRLESIELPDSVTSIRLEAFDHCESLRELRLPAKLLSIGDSAFQRCNGLTELIIPDTVKSIGMWAIFECANLKYLRLPKKVNESVNHIFYYYGIFPEYIIADLNSFPAFETKFRASLIRGFLYRWRHGELDEQDVTCLVTYIRKRLTSVFKDLCDHLPLYEFMTAYGGIPKRSIGRLLEMTKGIECRALLLEYSQVGGKR